MVQFALSGRKLVQNTRVPLVHPVAPLLLVPPTLLLLRVRVQPLALPILRAPLAVALRLVRQTQLAHPVAVLRLVLQTPLALRVPVPQPAPLPQPVLRVPAPQLVPLTQLVLRVPVHPLALPIPPVLRVQVPQLAPQTQLAHQVPVLRLVLQIPLAHQVPVHPLALPIPLVLQAQVPQLAPLTRLAHQVQVPQLVLLILPVLRVQVHPLVLPIPLVLQAQVPQLALLILPALQAQVPQLVPLTQLVLRVQVHPLALPIPPVLQVQVPQLAPLTQLAHPVAVHPLALPIPPVLRVLVPQLALQTRLAHQVQVPQLAPLTQLVLRVPVHPLALPIPPVLQVQVPQLAPLTQLAHPVAVHPLALPIPPVLQAQVPQLAPLTQLAHQVAVLRLALPIPLAHQVPVHPLALAILRVLRVPAPQLVPLTQLAHQLPALRLALRTLPVLRVRVPQPAPQTQRAVRVAHRQQVVPLLIVRIGKDKCVIRKTLPTELDVVVDTAESLWNTSANGISTVAAAGTGVGTYVSSEPVANLFDDSLSSRFSSRGNSSVSDSIAGLNTGFHATVAQCNAVLIGFRFGCANNSIQRDPIDITIEGTNCDDLSTCTNWTQLYRGPSGLSSRTASPMYGEYQAISNMATFDSYRFLVTNKRGKSSLVSYSEVQLFGYTNYTGSSSSGSANSSVPLTIKSGSIEALWNSTLNQPSLLATQGSSGVGVYSNNQGPDKLFDGDTTSRYTSRGYSNASNKYAGLNTGFFFTIARCQTTLSKFRFATGIAGASADPTNVTVEGTSCTTALNCTDWALIYDGPTGLLSIANRSTYGDWQIISSPHAYPSYRFTIMGKKGSSPYVSYSEVDLYGY
ncbi:unnamed protein product [Adineta ricciae]|uniref:Uncharacterized protein n=1 Tax=Adineta ricciae TaxID=249248 RepID=A0A815A3Y1_ADIRI|nr:unnamed protein product [Adineta ricciae]